MESMALRLDCAICDQTATLDEATPVQVEHLVDVWARTHTHTDAERSEYRQSLLDADRFDG